MIHRASYMLLRQTMLDIKDYTIADIRGRELIKDNNFPADFSIVLTCEGEMTDEIKAQTTYAIERFFKKENLSNSLDITYHKDKEDKWLLSITTVENAKQTIRLSYIDKGGGLYKCSDKFDQEVGVFIENIEQVANELCTRLQHLSNGITYKLEQYESKTTGTPLFSLE